MYGIDSPVRQLANQNAGNPQQLMQSYAQDPSLVKLLALEQLKQDLAAREASITAQLQNNPATILQQREQEVLGGISGARNTSNVTAQTAGSLNQQARQQQQAPQQAPQPGGSPMEQGIASQPATNMQRMASGGIVGFAEGGETSISAPSKAELESLGLTAAQFERMDDAEKQQVVGGINAVRSAAMAVQVPLGIASSIADVVSMPFRGVGYGAELLAQSPLGVGLGVTKPGAAKPTFNPMPMSTALDKRYKANQPDVDTAGVLAGLQGIETTPPTATDADRDALSQAAAAELAANNAPQSQAGPSQQPPPAGPSQQLPPAGLASLIQVPPLAEQSLEMQKLAADQLLRQQQAVARDPRAEGTAARDEAAAFQRRQEQQKDYAARIAAMDAANAEASDPKKLARERLISFLAGTANTGGLGSWGRGGVRAGQATQTAQRAAQQQRNLELFNAMNTASTADRAISGSALTEGANVRGEGEEARKAGETGIAGVLSADAGKRTQEQKLATEVAIANQATTLGINTANLKNVMDNNKLEVDRARNALLEKGQNINALLTSRDRNVKAISDTVAALQDSALVDGLRQAAVGKSPDSDEAIKYANALAAQKTAIAEATKENRKVLADLERRLATGYTGGTLLRP